MRVLALALVPVPVPVLVLVDVGAWKMPDVNDQLIQASSLWATNYVFTVTHTAQPFRWYSSSLWATNL